VARHWPEIEAAANTQRVAHFALRDAVEIVSARTVRVAALPAAAQETVVARAEAGASMVSALASARRDEHYRALNETPRALLPPLEGNGRTKQIRRCADHEWTSSDRAAIVAVWTIVLGPNRAGAQFPRLVEEARRADPWITRYAEAKAQADAMRREAADLRDRATRLD
jgi:hypothetical protein